MTTLNSNKNVLVRKQLAEFLLTIDEGDRLPPVNTMKEVFNSGTGTIQRALKDLEESQAAIFQSKQKQGTILVQKNIGLLWEIARLDPLMGLMPLPNSWEFQGLASGFRHELERLELPFTILYTHGSKNRLELLKTGKVDFIILSSTAAERVCSFHSQFKRIHTFHIGSYYAKDSVVIITRSNIDPFNLDNRIGVDYDSYDHTELSKKEFPEHNQLVNVSYPYLPQAVLNGQVDCAIWHKTALGLSLEQQGLIIHPLRNPKTIELANEMNRASIVTTLNQENKLSAVLKKMDLQKVEDIQQEVIHLKQLPLY